MTAVLIVAALMFAALAYGALAAATTVLWGYPGWSRVGKAAVAAVLLLILAGQVGP